MKFFKYSAVALFLITSNLSYAFQDVFTVGDLSNKLNASVNSGDQVVSLIGNEIMQSLQEAGVTLKEGELIFSLETGEEEIDGGCLATSWWGNAGIIINEESKLEYTLNSLKDPIEATVDVVGQIDVDGYYRVYLGTRIFGSCIRWGRNTSHLGLDADVGVYMNFKLFLDPRLGTDEYGKDIIILKPSIELNGEIYTFNARTDVDVLSGPIGSIISAPLDLALEGFIDYLINNYVNVDGYYQQFLAEKQAEWQGLFKEKIGMTAEQETKVVRFPSFIEDLSQEDVQKMLSIINSSYLSTFPISYEYVHQNRREIFYYLLVGDHDGLKRILAESLACDMSVELLSEIGQPTVWGYNNGACTAIDVRGSFSGPFYYDSNCQSQVSFSPENLERFCETVADPDKETLGNPQKWVAGEGSNWTVSPGTRFDITVNDIAGNTQPLMKRENYKSIYYPDLYGINSNKVDNLFNPFDPYGPPAGSPLGADSIAATDRQEVFDLCMEAAVSSGRIVNVGSDPFNAVMKYFSCIPELPGMELDSTFYPTSWTSHWQGSLNRNQDYFITYANGNYEVHKLISHPFFGNSYTKIDVTSDSYYNHALNMIEQYGIPQNAVVMARENYTCDLEMRVYKKNLNATNLKPLLAIHGGAWKYRGFAFAGLESQISHLTEQGFAVFAPFYRLAGESEGNAECNGYTWEDITSDAKSALDWVIAHGSVFGANVNNGVAVFGQSAGGHLGGWLAVNEPSKVSKAMLMYPPVDFEHYISQTLNGNIYNEQGKSIIETFIGETFDQLDVYGPKVQANSFPRQIAGNPNAYPPVYLIHGSSDDLVPVDQSQRMCAAYTGSVANSLSQNPDGSYACGSSGGKLEIIPGAEHALEVCIEGAVCLAGDEAKAQQAIENGIQWLAQ